MPDRARRPAQGTVVGSTLDTLMASDLASAEAVAGQTMTHVAADGTETAATGQFHEDGPPVREPFDDGRGSTRTATVVVAKSALADPQPGDVLSVGADSWSVSTRQPLAGDTYWRLQIQRRESEERSRREFRTSG